MLRSSATTHCWDCVQARQLVQLITYRQRVDAVVILFRRIVDPGEFYETVYLVLKPGECAALRSRLGAPLLRLLPPEEPEEQLAEDTAVVFLTEQADGLIDAAPAANLEVSAGAPVGAPAPSGTVAESTSAPANAEIIGAEAVAVDAGGDADVAAVEEVADSPPTETHAGDLVLPAIA
mmetsp:Transcript_64368/g.143820  ORF Transcript_64368/g.143820 Transcript_64368/m.143820 type:complete len:178 (-) Transcript_64368:344-877(-)